MTMPVNRRLSPPLSPSCLMQVPIFAMVIAVNWLPNISPACLVNKFLYFFCFALI
ncbi:hypothetical protein BCR42DRAFT_426675 [Absidia repens]|uniref:Uncharacterized protein n=1 Tax=Absidia repens TaxID=90262 RepID=A0A1X2I288_9FUNG|nr:hypothetical protein BCR42DRAFT_426675 [Absidia repens]